MGRLEDKIAAAKARQQAAKDQLRQAGDDHRNRVDQINAERDARLADINNQQAAARQQHADQQPTPPAQQQPPQGPVTFGKFILDRGHIQRGVFDRKPLPGVTAALGDPQRGKGGGLLRGAGVLAGSLTAAASALNSIGAKQLTITGPGWRWEAEVPAHKVDKAQAFVDAVNTAAQQQ